MTTYHLPKPQHFETTINGKNTHLFQFTNRAGMQIALTDYGARLVSALVPDKNGNLVDVVLGFDRIEGYINAKEVYHGATIGRYANRIANGEFVLDNKTYKLQQNNGNNCLHGGAQGFHSKVWDRQVSFKKKVDFYYVSAANEEGFPSEVKVNVSYELTNENEIIIQYRASAEENTVLSMTNHAYFNLNGEGNGNILNHFIQIKAEEFVPINSEQIPIGNFHPVEGTAFDFRTEKKIVQDINSPEKQIQMAKGYDHSFVNNQLISSPIASAYSEGTGILLEVFTDFPSLHLYTGNYLADDFGKAGHHYLPNGGFCFEAGHFPDSPNQKNFPSVIVGPDKPFEYTLKYKFSIRK